jgi:hypothetical protein
MSVFTIRAHRRFAVCRKVRLRQEKRRGIDGLLIELSRDGCRISHAAKTPAFAIEDIVTLAIAGIAPIAARVRWLHDGAVGLRFAQPLPNAALESLIRHCRSTDEALADDRLTA